MELEEDYIYNNVLIGKHYSRWLFKEEFLEI